MLCHNAECRYAESHVFYHYAEFIMLCVVMLNDIVLSFVMLSVVAPQASIGDLGLQTNFTFFSVLFQNV